MGSIITKFFNFKDDKIIVDSNLINIEKIDITVDRVVEIDEIIWRNFSKNGLRVKTRSINKVCTIFFLLFLTTPTVN